MTPEIQTTNTTTGRVQSVPEPEMRKILESARTFPSRLRKVSGHPEVRKRIVKAGAQVCRAIAYRLRYQGSQAIADASRLEEVVATALFDQRVFEAAKNENSARLIKSVASVVIEALREYLNRSSLYALQFLELSVMTCELEKGMFEEG